MSAAEIVWNSINITNEVIGILFMAFYAYQILFVLVPIFIRKPKHSEKPLRKYGIFISARNEEVVIKNLIDSIKNACLYHMNTENPLKCSDLRMA